MAWLLTILLLLLPMSSWASRTIPGDQPIHIRVELTKLTVLILPIPLIRVILTKVEGVSIDAKDNHVGITMSNPDMPEYRFMVIDERGKGMMVWVELKKPADDMVYVALPTPTSGAAPVRAPSLMRSLWLGMPLPGQVGADVSPPALPDQRLTLLEAQAVTVNGLVGMTLLLRNTTPQPLTLDLRLGEPAERLHESTVMLSSWIWPPGLVVKAVATEMDVVPPETQSKVWVIFEQRR
jgi:hypothetical protein